MPPSRTPEERQEFVTEMIQNHEDDDRDHESLRLNVKEATLEDLNELAKQVIEKNQELNEKGKKAFKEETIKKLNEEKDSIKTETISHLGELLDLPDPNAGKPQQSENGEMIDGWLKAIKPYAEKIPLIGGWLATINVRSAEKMWYSIIARVTSFLPQEMRGGIVEEWTKPLEVGAKTKLVQFEIEEALGKISPPLTMGEKVNVLDVTSDDLSLIEEGEKQGDKKIKINIKQKVKEYIAFIREKRAITKERGVIQLSVEAMLSTGKEREQLAEIKIKKEKEKMLKDVQNDLPDVTEVTFGEKQEWKNGVLTLIKGEEMKIGDVLSEPKNRAFIDALKTVSERNNIAITVEPGDSTIDRRAKSIKIEEENLGSLKNTIDILLKDEPENISVVKIVNRNDAMTNETIKLEQGEKNTLMCKRELAEKLNEHWDNIPWKDMNGKTAIEWKFIDPDDWEIEKIAS